MNTPGRRMLALAACTVALLVVGAEAQQGSQAEGGRFVKVGGHHINVDRILYTRAVGDSLEVVFGGDGVGSGFAWPGTRRRRCVGGSTNDRST